MSIVTLLLILAFVAMIGMHLRGHGGHGGGHAGHGGGHGGCGGGHSHGRDDEQQAHHQGASTPGARAPQGARQPAGAGSHGGQGTHRHGC